MRVQKNAARRPIVGAKSRGATLLTGKRPSQCADTVILCADLNAITRSAISCGLLRGVIQKRACAGSQSMACFPVPPAATYSSLRRICRLFAVNDNTPGGKLQVWSAIFNPESKSSPSPIALLVRGAISPSLRCHTYRLSRGDVFHHPHIQQHRHPPCIPLP